MEAQVLSISIVKRLKKVYLKFFRRLCPDISFFQQATEFPCDAVVNSGGSKRLHRRVEHSVLKSANVERKGLGVTRVSWNFHSCLKQDIAQKSLTVKMIWIPFLGPFKDCYCQPLLVYWNWNPLLAVGLLTHKTLKKYYIWGKQASKTTTIIMSNQ